MQDFARALADFVRDNQVWAAPIVMLLAFCKSLAFISLLVPAWGALVAIGALIGVSGISFWPVWLAGELGAALGDWVSYWFGYRYKERVAEMWPFVALSGNFAARRDVGAEMGRALRSSSAASSDPCAPRCRSPPAFSRWPTGRFQIANFVSALVWSAVLLLVGDVMGKLAEWLWRAV